MAGRIAYYGNIVTDGLILDLDAAKKDSYPGSGNTWRDISGNGNNGTLTNDPTYDSANGGSIVFDGTNDYINCGNNSSVQITVGSINAWFKGNQQGGDYNGIVVKQSSWGIFMFQNNLYVYDWGNAIGRNTSVSVSDNIWRNVCLTFSETIGTPSNNAIVYINGSSILTTTVKNEAQNQPLLIGYGNSGAQYLRGSISNTQIYNRVLSSQEVLQNYNAQKGRFGL